MKLEVLFFGHDEENKVFKTWFLVFGLSMLCHRTVSNPITAEMHTSEHRDVLQIQEPFDVLLTP